MKNGCAVPKGSGWMVYPCQMHGVYMHGDALTTMWEVGMGSDVLKTSLVVLAWHSTSYPLLKKVLVVFHAARHQ
jgi:hypothetical protein